MIYYMLSGLVGALVSWLFIYVKIDRYERKYREKYLGALDSKSIVEERNYYLKQENDILLKIIAVSVYNKELAADIMITLCKNPEIADKVNRFLKQEKDKCPE